MNRAKATYLGGLSRWDHPEWGRLTIDEEAIRLDSAHGGPPLVIGTAAIASIEITSEQAAKASVGAVLVFGVLGGLAARGSRDRGTLLVHLNNEETAYFALQGWSEAQLRANLAMWIRATGVRVGPPLSQQVALTRAVVSLADEIKKLSDLRDAGILTDEEFTAQKAKLLGA